MDTGGQHRTHGRGVEDEEARQYPRVYAFLQTEAYQRQIPIDYPAMHIGNEFIVDSGWTTPVGPELQGCLRGDRIVR